LNHDFVTAVKLLGLLVYGVWEHMNHQKRVVLNCIDVVNPIIKSFVPLVDGKIFNQ